MDAPLFFPGWFAKDLHHGVSLSFVSLVEFSLQVSEKGDDVM